ncbi:MAG: DUF427 domain-containing protein [Pseudomonadota bacterium]
MPNPAPGFLRHPHHTITIAPPARLSVHINGTLIAKSVAARQLQEDGYPPRAYIPAADIFATLERTQRTTHCPFKGDTQYFDVSISGQTFENAAWCYPAPFDEMAAIEGHIAFDDRFEFSET